MRIIKIMGLLLACACPISLSGCQSQGRDLTYDDAQVYFANYKVQLEAIVAAEEKCRPVYQNGDLVIRIDDISAISCANGDLKTVPHIRDMLKKARVQMLFTRRENDDDRVSKFLMHSEGLGVSGGGTFIFNTAQPSIPANVYLDTDQEVRSMKALPDHWFWGRGWS
ncbi:hypothetical protein [Asticcacaulis sp. MM231]|uniref:hypothetical protein n=1 Tax=Asticcacaulis sp. MM231 TaxID=3157666 RepID=UPI0032D5AEAA